ncbi:energy transducer TonB [Winogradskyella sp. A3E31]|uniref:energy transducer TonB n=1 Tax=Winogradskyella sp. A3E31 TaxID=3349637 RepID=UPI00398B9039
MKNLKKFFRNAGQSATEVKKPQKHDVNLQKNSGLYFQVGLILCLLGTFALFEMQFETKYISEMDTDIAEVEDITIPFHDFKIERVVEKQEPKERAQKVTDIIKEVPNEHDEIFKKLITSEEPNFDPPLDPGKIEDPVKVNVPDDVPFIFVQHVPVFPGCEKYTDNKDRRDCMSKKINKIVQRKFDTNIASKYGLTGVQKIDVQFIVNKEGFVTGIKTRAPHPKLEEEAERVINKIPQMKPGMQQAKPVNVIYTLPIKFQVRD